jgi:Tol biopolymer transport system component
MVAVVAVAVASSSWTSVVAAPYTRGTTTVISLDDNDTQMTDVALDSDLGRGCRLVAFVAPYESPSRLGVFLRDRSTGRTSLASAGVPSGVRHDAVLPALSHDGRIVAFVSGPAGAVSQGDDVYVFDMSDGSTRLVSGSASSSTPTGATVGAPSLSADGRFVAFASRSADLVPGDDNASIDVFLHDRKRNTTRIVSSAWNGAFAHGDSDAPTVTADGRFVAFTSTATDLVRKDSNAAPDVFVRDMEKPRAHRVSVRVNGDEASRGGSEAVISADGRMVAFSSTSRLKARSPRWRSIYVRDLRTQRLDLASVNGQEEPATRSSYDPSISDDGRFVAFTSEASNIGVPKTSLIPDVFVRDRLTGTTHLVSRSSDGSATEEGNSAPSVSGNGRCIAFYGQALGETSPTGTHDVYLRDRRDPSSRDTTG